MKLFKKRFDRILAFYMSIVLFITMLIVPVTFVSAVANSYSATLLDMRNTATNNENYNSKLTANSTELTPEISATSLSFGWKGSTIKNNTSNYMYVCTTNSGSTTDTYKLTENSAIMFYVKTAIDSPENQLFFQFQTSTRGDENTYGIQQWIAPLKNTTIYYLAKGNTEWEERIAPVSTVDNSKGNVVLPAGYEGWIRIPYDNLSMYKDRSMEIFRLNFYLKSVGGDYTEGGVTVGTFMLVEDGSQNLTNISFDGISENSLLVDLPCHNTHLINPDTVDGATPCENETVIPSGYTYSASEKDVKFNISDEASVTKSIISYIRVPLGTESNVKITANNIPITPNSSVFLINRGNKEWEEHKSDINGNIVLSNGFEGYILLPSSVFNDLKDKKLDNITFNFDITGASVGSIMLSDNAEKEICVRLDTDRTPIYLIKKAYYNANLIDTDETITSNISDNIYYSAASKVTDNSFSVGVDGGYHYEFSVGTADVGEYSLNSSIVEQPYTTHIASNYSAPSGRYWRPWDQTAFKVSVQDSVIPFATKEFTFSAGNACTDANDSNYLNTTTGIFNNTASYSTGYYMNATFSETSWTTSGAVMFYVKSNGTKDSQLFMMNATKWVFIQNGTKYYRLGKTSDSWEECTTVFNKEKAGNIVIPAGFEGWIRIPTTSFGNWNGVRVDNHTFNTIQIFPCLLGGEYGEVSVSHLMTVDEGNKNYFSIEENQNEIKLTSASTQKKFNITIGNLSGEKTFVTDAGAGEVYSIISLKEAMSFSNKEAFMFYVRQSGRTGSQMRIAFGNQYMQMITGAAYSLYDALGEYWSDYNALEDGKIEIPAGFSGWVRIPYSSVTNSEKQIDSDGFMIDKIYISPYQLGAAYGTLKIGSFLITDNGNKNLTTMRVEKSKEIKITALDAYTAKMLAVESILPIGENARNVTISSENWPLLTGGYHYRVKSNYETIEMNVESGLEIELKEPVQIEKENGIIIYINLSEGKENTLLLGDKFAVNENAKYYILSSGNEGVWQEKSADASGGINLPSKFNGYVRVPFSSMLKEPSGEIDKIILAFANVGERYGEPTFGSIMISDNASLNFTDVYIDALSYPQTLMQANYYEGYLLQGKISEEDTDNRISALKEDGNAVTSAIPEGYAYKVSSTSGTLELASNEYTPRMVFTVDELYRSKLSASGAIMFYVDISDCAENTLYLQAVGDIYATPNAGSRYSILNEGHNYWQEQVSNADGDITLPAGFKGWIRVPYTSLKSPSSTYLSTVIKYFNFTFRNVGGEYGEPKVASVIQLANNGDFGLLKFSGYDNKINLYGSVEKTLYNRNDIAIWSSVTTPLIGYSDGENISMNPTIDKEIEIEATSTFASNVVSKLTPFDVKGVTLSSTNAITMHGELPRFTMTIPFALRDSVGIALYVKMPKNDAETNSLFVQIKTFSNKWLTIKREYMIPILEKGEKEWDYAFVNSGKIGLSSGFEGYVYIPFDTLMTYPNAQTGKYDVLQENDIIQNIILAAENFGGEIGNVTLGGIFLSQNGILSHNGVYLDDDTVCRDLFSGNPVKEDDVKYTIYDIPSIKGKYLKNLPEPTDSNYLIFKENLTGHSVDLLYDAYPNANKYRCDIYKTILLEGTMSSIYYEYIDSYWSNDTKVSVSGLEMGNYYTAVISAHKDNTGLAIYSLCSILPEGQVVGNMLYASDDPYKYEWGSDTSDSEEWEYEEIWEEEIIEEDSEDDEKTKKKYLKKVMRRKRKGGLETWHWILIALGGVIIVASATLLIIFLTKKKRRKNK